MPLSKDQKPQVRNIVAGLDYPRTYREVVTISLEKHDSTYHYHCWLENQVTGIFNTL
jgi:hypothetical protein